MSMFIVQSINWEAWHQPIGLPSVAPAEQRHLLTILLVLSGCWNVEHVPSSGGKESEFCLVKTFAYDCEHFSKTILGKSVNFCPAIEYICLFFCSIKKGGHLFYCGITSFPFQNLLKWINPPYFIVLLTMALSFILTGKLISVYFIYI